jgi:hypothetical protein
LLFYFLSSYPSVFLIPCFRSLVVFLLSDLICFTFTISTHHYLSCISYFSLQRHPQFQRPLNSLASPRFLSTSTICLFTFLFPFYFLALYRRFYLKSVLDEFELLTHGQFGQHPPLALHCIALHLPSSSLFRVHYAQNHVPLTTWNRIPTLPLKDCRARKPWNKSFFFWKIKLDLAANVTHCTCSARMLSCLVFPSYTQYSFSTNDQIRQFPFLIWYVLS